MASEKAGPDRGKRMRLYKIKHQLGRSRRNIATVRGRTARSAVKRCPASLSGGYVTATTPKGKERRFATSLVGTACERCAWPRDSVKRERTSAARGLAV